MICRKLLKQTEHTPGDHYDNTKSQPKKKLHRDSEGKQKNGEAGETEAGDL